MSGQMIVSTAADFSSGHAHWILAKALVLPLLRTLALSARQGARGGEAGMLMAAYPLEERVRPGCIAVHSCRHESGIYIIE